MRCAASSLLLAFAHGAVCAADAPIIQPSNQVGWGSPVVVFEHGAGDSLNTWRTVQTQVSPFAETFAYTRAGYVGSPAANGTRDARTIVGELRTLLASRGLRPPYLLVGHSSGGLYMQYFARNFPDEVVGLVLVDSSHPQQDERMRRISRSMAENVAAARSSAPGIMGREGAAFGQSGRQVQDSRPLRPMPLVVLTASRYPPQIGAAAIGTRVGRRQALDPAFWLGLQQDLAAQVPDSQHRVVKDANHFIQIEQPKAVTTAVIEMIVELRKRGAASSR